MSLTPASRNAEATQEAISEGAFNGLLTLIPTTGAVYWAMHNSAGFAKRTNFQARTALAIMPALFVFALTAESRLTNKMHEIAQETQHTTRTVEWAEQKARNAAINNNNQAHKTTNESHAHISDLYRQSVLQSGFRIVPGDTLGLHHRAANYLASNPIKVLAGVAIPSVAYIFYGRSGQQHLDFSVKLMHTRVFGQFATISLLLSVMGFKEYMDQQGKYITQAEADARVEEMKRVRMELLDRLEQEHQHELDLKAEIAAAHEKDVKAGYIIPKKHKHSQHQHTKQETVPAEVSAHNL